MPLKRHVRIMTEALSSGERRDYQRAAELLLGLISETDEFPEAYLYLGRSFHALGRIGRAIQFLDFFVQLEPDVSAGHFFLGRAYAARGMFSEALRHLTTADAIDPDNPQILGLLGLAYLRQRRTQRAVAILGRAVELDPENRRLYSGYLNSLAVEAIRLFRRDEIDLSRQMLEFLLDRGWSNTTIRLYLAYCYRAMDRYEEALEQYDRIVSQEPGDPSLQLQRADILLRLGEEERAKATIADVEPELAEADTPELYRLTAIEAFEQGRYRRAVEFAKSVIRLTESNFEMHLLLGEAFRCLSSLEKAINHFNRAVKLERSRIEPRYGIVLANWQRERFDEVLRACRSILALSEDDETARYYSALSKAMLEYPPEEVIPELEWELEESGPDPHLCTALGAQYAAIDRLDAAERQYRMAIDLSETHRPAYEGLFDLLEARGETTKLAETYHAYFERFPDDGGRRREYIQLLVSLERYEHAVEQIERQLPSDERTEELRRLQAFCYRRVGKYREAGIIYRQLLKDTPDSAFYLRALAFCLERSGNRERAILLMQRAFEYRPPTSTMRLIFGVLLFRADRLDEALQEFRTALDDREQDWRVYSNIAAVYRRKGNVETADRFDARAAELSEHQG